MRKLLTFLIALGAIVFAVVSPVSANGVLILAGSKPATSSYQGPGDIVSGATAWWGLRGYNGAYATGSSPAIVVCDTATFSTCSTINILSNGNLDAATAAGSPACATACVIQSFTDQTGNGHTASCASASVCATLTFNCINSTLPCATGNSTTSYSVSPTIAVTTGFTMSAVWNRATGVGGFEVLCCTPATNSTPAFGSTSTGNQGYANNGGGNQTFTLANPASHITTIVFNGASSVAVVDATTTAIASVGTTGGTINGFFRGNNLSVTGNVEEFGIWGSTAFNSTQYGNTCHNAYSYWATSVSC